MEIPVVFHNGSKYDYHFIIKELVEELQGKFECLRKNTEKVIRFSVLTKKENKTSNTTTYKIKIIDSVRFMVSSLSSLPDNIKKGLDKGKCENCKSYLEYMTVNDGFLVFKCVNSNKNYEKTFHEDLAKQFEST